MSDAPKHNQSRSRAEGLAKLVPSRHRQDSDKQDAESRRKARNGRSSLDNHPNRDKHHRSTRQAAKDTVQSALELRPPINFDHLLRRDKRTPVPSRRTSGINVDGNGDLDKLQQQTRLLQRRVGITDVDKSKEENEKREQELRSALESVEEQGLRNITELDNTYYVLLEKAEAMREIVSHMQKLAKDSRSLKADFQDKSKALHHDAEQAIEGYDNFAQQERAIKSLLGRLESSKKRAAALNERLEAAKTRAETCQRHVVDAQTQRKKRWETTWGVMLFLVVVVVGVVVAQHSRGKHVLHVSIDDVPADFVSPVLARLKKKPGDDAFLHNLFDGIS